MKMNIKYVIAVSSTALLASGASYAGGIERAHSPYAILFEKGNYAELSFGSVKPTIEGKAFGQDSGNMSKRYSALGLGVKYAINDQLDVAFVFDQPNGADVAYPAGTTYPIAGTTAKVDSNALTALARYKFDGGFAVHGGIKVQRSMGEVDIKGSSSYKMHTANETDVGYIIGATYERPDIALRVGLTYQSAITHKFSATEVTGMGTFNSNFETEVPQSVTLDFQSGVAEDTLVFGSIRWREWSAFKIAPTYYMMAPGATPLVAYAEDTVTYTLGVGRKFTENFSGAVSYIYEEGAGKPTGNLGPHDGAKGITIGGTYTQDNMKISAGVSYMQLGHARTNPPLNAEFGNNKAIGVGVKVGYSF